MLFPVLHGTSLTVSGTSIDAQPIFCLRSKTKNSFLHAAFLPVIYWFQGHFTDRLGAQLKINPLYAILSGFEVGDTPGVGTFYDFLNRLWDSDSDNLNPHVRPVKTKKVKKPKQKGAKAESVEKTTVEQLLKALEQKSFSIDDQPYGSLFRLYQKEFLEQSVKRKLITPESLAVGFFGQLIEVRQFMVFLCFLSHYHLYPTIIVTVDKINYNGFIIDSGWKNQLLVVTPAHY